MFLPADCKHGCFASVDCVVVWCSSSEEVGVWRLA